MFQGKEHDNKQERSVINNADIMQGQGDRKKLCKHDIVDHDGSETRDKTKRRCGREDGEVTDSDSSPERECRKIGRPLKSGILTKLDESGIKKVVQYAHEKLWQENWKSF